MTNIEFLIEELKKINNQWYQKENFEHDELYFAYTLGVLVRNIPNFLHSNKKIEFIDSFKKGLNRMSIEKRRL